MKEVKFSVKVGWMDMFRFLMAHSYRGVALFLNILITGVAVFFLVTGFSTNGMPKNLMLLLLAALFTVIYPLQLLFKAVRQVKNPVFKDAIQYVLNDTGICMSQGEEKQEFTWADVFQIRETKNLMMVYTGRVYACLWPKKAYADCKDEVLEILSKKLQAPVYKSKKKAN